MARRSDLLIQDLKDLLGTDEVYFQPAPDGETDAYGNSFIFTGMDYPCFVMKRTRAFQSRANDHVYIFRPGYEVTYINRDEPDPEMVEMVMQKFPCCHYERHYVADNLHHDLFMIYY